MLKNKCKPGLNNQPYLPNSRINHQVDNTLISLSGRAIAYGGLISNMKSLPGVGVYFTKTNGFPAMRLIAK